jgi:RND family efflux transporter MFP subunit
MTHFGKIAALLIVLFGLGAGVALVVIRPRAKPAPPKRILDSVEAITVKREAIQVILASQGILESATETNVSAEVAGKVVSVSPKFEVGEAFAQDNMILEIDPSDYQAAVSQSEASLAEAKVALDMELARAHRAEKDWEKLGDGDEPTALALRKPQVESAKAKILAAEAALAKAQRDLQRTVIRAPYPCRVRSKSTDIGSYLGPGGPVAELYRIDALEVRLPLALDDFGFLVSDQGGDVKFRAEAGINKFDWSGSIVRSEREVQRTSRSVFLVARIEPQNLDASFSRFVLPGLFVQASVSGATLENVIRIPRKAIYGTDRVLTISSENKVSYREVEIVRTEEDYVIVSDGVEEGERISVTPLDAVIDKMEVIVEKLDGVPTKPMEPSTREFTDGDKSEIRT